MALTSKQKALLHIAPQRLGIDAETRLDIQEDLGGARSAKDMSFQGFLAVMRYYEGCGFECNLGPEPGKAHSVIEAIKSIETRGKDDAAERPGF